MRTTIDLSGRQVEALGRVSKIRNVSRAKLIREAVDRYLALHLPQPDAAFGLWKRTDAAENGIAYQKRLRREWGH